MMAWVRWCFLVGVLAVAGPSAAGAQLSQELFENAEQGNVHAQYLLGLIYVNGEGVPRDYEEAIHWFRQAASQDHAGAQFNLGVFYDRGDGVPRDYEEAARWYHKAADQGFAHAQYNLGILYGSGEGVPRDYEEAARWYRKAADQGDSDAQYNLGVFYSKGRGVPRDYEEAARLYRKAADQGDPDSQFNLGVLYNKGDGVPRDYDEAARWYLKAADQGDSDAQYNLGLLYYNGEGVSRDYAEAYKWINLSAAQSDDDARNFLNLLERRLTPNQIAEGQRRAQEWQLSEDVARAELPGTSPTLPGVMTDDLISTGSGFMVTHSGHVLTNNHVVEGCSAIRISSSLSTVKVVARNEEIDLALLRYDSGRAFSPVRWRGGQEIRLGEDIIIAGYPLQGILTPDLGVTTGIISALSGIGGDRRHLQITAPVQPGNSGGPLLDRAGRVSGIVVEELDEIIMATRIGDIPQNVNFAIRSGVARAFMDAHGVEYVISSDDDALSTADIAEQARSYTVRVECWK